MWQTVPETSFNKLVVYPDHMYVILTMCIKVVNTIVFIKWQVFQVDRYLLFENL